MRFVYNDTYLLFIYQNKTRQKRIYVIGTALRNKLFIAFDMWKYIDCTTHTHTHKCIKFYFRGMKMKKIKYLCNMIVCQSIDVSEIGNGDQLNRSILYM